MTPNIEIKVFNTIRKDSIYIFFSSLASADRDWFEWYNHKNRSIDKAIYIKDPYKSWYLGGVNSTYDTVSKLLKFLVNETNGYKNITAIGASSGGYASLLFGTKLKANKILIFSAYFDLENKKSYILENLKKYNKSTKQFEEYKDITDLVNNSNSNIYYFVGKYSKEDQDQIRYSKNITHLKTFLFNSYIHGIPFCRGNLTSLVFLDIDELNKLYLINKNKTISSLLWCLKFTNKHSLLKLFISIYKFIKNNYLNKDNILISNKTKQETSYQFAQKLSQCYHFINNLPKNNIRYVIYGNSTTAILIENILRKNIVYCVDKNPNTPSIIQSNFYPLSKLNEENFDFIIIAVIGRELEIINELIDLYKIEKNKIIIIELT